MKLNAHTRLEAVNIAGAAACCVAAASFGTED